MSIYDSLNKEQQSAVFHTDGPVLILAGAGSGKTRVITHRIAYLIEECSVNPWNILAITFTNKAAGEMRERVDRLVGFGAESVWVSTFHSMCVRILRRHIDLLGYDTGFTIYDTDDSKTLMKQVMKTLNIDPKQLKERTILSAVSSAKNQLESPLKYREAHTFSFQEKQIADAYEEYQKQLFRNNALDFDDLLMKTVELFSSHDEVLHNYQDRFRYIMVDEYQDTNAAQFELVRQLSGGSRNLCVVGDDDQSIYRFRGADIRNILDFEKVFPDTFVVRLEQNYRSTQNILDAANAVIHNNVNRKQKALWTSEGAGAKIRYRQLDNALDEAAFIADDVQRKMKENTKLHYRDFAVLYRTNAQSRVLEERFVMESIPYNLVGGTNFYSRREIKDLLAYLKTVDNGADDLAVRRILNVPRRGIGQTTEERIAGYAAMQGIGFFEAMEQADSIPSLSRSTASKLAPFVELVHSFRDFLEERRGDDSALSDLLKKIIQDTGYDEELKNSEEDDVDDRLANIDELVSKVVTYEETEGEEAPTLSGFLAEVALVADIDKVGEEDDRVLLMTLHSAKGLEFSQVYIAGMEDGVFPGQMSIDAGNQEEMEEERRLAYVGITRAKDDLTITCAKIRMLRGETRYNPVSRFVGEIPAALLDGRPAKQRRFGSYDPDDEEDEDMPFGDYEGGSSDYGTFESFAKSYGSSRGSTYVTYGNVGRSRQEESSGRGWIGTAGQNKGDSRLYAGTSSGAVGKTPAYSSDGRPRAVYRKPSTPDSRKPYLVRANESLTKLNAIGKGMPEAGTLEYVEGDRVQHVKFGEGIVRKIESTPRDYKVTVEFDDYGQKVMYAAFAKLKKVIE